MREHATARARADGGFMIVEIAVAMSLLVVGIVGFLGAVVSSHVLSRTAREMNIASTALTSVIEEFKKSCAVDFDAALTTYSNQTLDPARLVGTGTERSLTTFVELDETALDPPLDLNGDGDFLDTGLAPSQVKAAMLRVRATWHGVAGQRELEFTTIVARGEAR